MNKKIIITLGVIIILLLGTFIYLKLTAPQEQGIIFDQPSLTREEYQDLTSDHLDEALADLEEVTEIP